MQTPAHFVGFFFYSWSAPICMFEMRSWCVWTSILNSSQDRLGYLMDKKQESGFVMVSHAGAGPGVELWAPPSSIVTELRHFYSNLATFLALTSFAASIFPLPHRTWDQEVTHVEVSNRAVAVTTMLRQWETNESESVPLRRCHFSSLNVDSTALKLSLTKSDLTSSFDNHSQFPCLLLHLLLLLPL